MEFVVFDYLFVSANSLGSIECKPIPELSTSCADMAHLVKQASILEIVAKQQWVGPVISHIGFQVSWQLFCNNVSNSLISATFGYL